MVQTSGNVTQHNYNQRSNSVEETFDNLTLDNYSIEELETGKASHTLDKADFLLAQNGDTYEMTITEHPSGGSRARASRVGTTEVYRGKLAGQVPEIEEDLEGLLEGETLDRAY